MSGPNAGRSALATTNSAGQASFTYTSNGQPGTDTIQASSSIDGASTTCQATVNWQGVNQPPACAIDPPSTTSLGLEPITVRAQVTRNGVVQPGAPVNFRVISGPDRGQIASATTNQNGRAPFTYQPQGNQGTDTIEASGAQNATSFSCRATVQLVRGDEAQCTINPISMTKAVTVRVMRNGVNAAGVAVDFSILVGPNADAPQRSGLQRAVRAALYESRQANAGESVAAANLLQLR